MKKRKFVGMSNAEYLKRLGLCDFYEYCPYKYGLENHYRACGVPCESINDCKKCWELPAIRNGRYILKEVKE